MRGQGQKTAIERSEVRGAVSLCSGHSLREQSGRGEEASLKRKAPKRRKNLPMAFGSLKKEIIRWRRYSSGSFRFNYFPPG